MSHVVAEVTLLHASPPRCIGFVVTNLGNILTETIAFCHAVVEIHQLVVIVNDVGVEVVFQTNSSATEVI